MMGELLDTILNVISCLVVLWAVYVLFSDKK
jgi:hypothetical protein